MNLIQKLEKRSSELLLTKLLSMKYTEYLDHMHLIALANKMVRIGFYGEVERTQFLSANGIKPF